MYRDLEHSFIVTEYNENDEDYDVVVTVQFRAHFHLDNVLGRLRYVLSEVELLSVDPPKYEEWILKTRMDKLVEIAEYNNPEDDENYRAW